MRRPSLIARFRNGMTRTAQADACLASLLKRALPGYRGIPSHLAAYILTRPQGELPDSIPPRGV